VTVDELDQLLSERFNLQRADLLAALKTRLAIKPGAAVLTEDEARLLDEAGFVEDPVGFAEAAADIVADRCTPKLRHNRVRFDIRTRCVDVAALRS
jgi:hypothetical protein